jgi:hypothetical protein
VDRFEGWLSDVEASLPSAFLAYCCTGRAGIYLAFFHSSVELLCCLALFPQQNANRREFNKKRVALVLCMADGETTPHLFLHCSLSAALRV